MGVGDSSVDNAVDNGNDGDDAGDDDVNERQKASGTVRGKELLRSALFTVSRYFAFFTRYMFCLFYYFECVGPNCILYSWLVKRTGTQVPVSIPVGYPGLNTRKSDHYS